jgi:transcriptional regulator with XRE-family HTH domain
MTIKFNNETKWLERMAKTEDYAAVTAGGVFARSPAQGQARATGSEPKVLGMLVGLARRQNGLSVPELAKKADIDLAEALAIEMNTMSEPQPRTVYGLANALNLPAAGLMELAGLVQRRGDKLASAAVRFAAKAEPTAKLSRDERDALEEFVKVLAESSDRK